MHFLGSNVCRHLSNRSSVTRDVTRIYQRNASAVTRDVATVQLSTVVSPSRLEARRTPRQANDSQAQAHVAAKRSNRVKTNATALIHWTELHRRLASPCQQTRRHDVNHRLSVTWSQVWDGKGTSVRAGLEIRTAHEIREPAATFSRIRDLNAPD